MGTDAYAQIANGNLLLATLPPDRRKPEDARRADDRLFKVSIGVAPLQVFLACMLT